ALEIGLDLRMPREELLEVGLRLLGGNREPAREAEGGHAVDHGEVGGLGHVSLLRRHLRRIDPEDLGSGAPVNVLAAPERLDQTLLPADVSQDAELDLRVVGGKELPARFGHERGADAAAELGADRDVLDVWIVRGQPPRHRYELVERRVDASGAWI